VGSTSTAIPPRREILDGHEDPRDLLLRWGRDRDPQARELLVRRFAPLARSLARRYAHTSEPFEDLMQVASLGLVKALERFDPEQGVAFASFAVPTILGELRRYFRDSSWGVHVPRDLQEQTLKVGRAQEQLCKEHGRAPTAGELAVFLELDTEQVLEALQAAQAYEALPLDAPTGGSATGNGEEGMTYLDALGSEDEHYELGATVATALRSLRPRERAIVKMRFLDELSQAEIGRRIGISQMQVSRLLRRSLEQLSVLARAQADAP
jgi:RNA polymerase sigma-B factor